MDKTKVFVIIPFKEEFHQLYDNLKSELEDKYFFINANDVDNPQNILRDILKAMNECDVILADLTEANPNVFYELGIAHSLNKKVIMITQNIERLPFDLSKYRVLKYGKQFHEFNQFKHKLCKYIDGIISGEMTFGNPVKDFLDTQDVIRGNSDSNELNLIDHAQNPILENVLHPLHNFVSNGDARPNKGILNCMTDIYAKVDIITVDITNINNNIDKISNNLNVSSINVEGNVNAKSYMDDWHG